MHVVITKVDEIFFDGDAESATFPATAGQMTVLAGHEPLITTLKAGTISVRSKDDGEKSIEIESGVLEVRPDGATVII